MRFVLLFILSFLVMESGFSQCPGLKVDVGTGLCINGSPLDLLTKVTLDGINPSINDGEFLVLEFNHSRTDPKVFSTTLQSGYIFKPSSGVGSWLIRYEYTKDKSCGLKDSFLVTVNSKPELILKDSITICEKDILHLSDLIDTNNGINPSEVRWPEHPTGILITDTLPSYFYLSMRKYSLLGVFNDSITGCSDSELSLIKIRTRPSIRYKGKRPWQTCLTNGRYAMDFEVGYYDSLIKWGNTGGSKGTFYDARIFSTKQFASYKPDSNDLKRGFAWVTAETEAANSGTCPVVKDSLQLIFNKAPMAKIISDPVSGCIPFTLKGLKGVETSGMDTANLYWSWYFGNGVGGHGHNPKEIIFNYPGIYYAQLVVENKIGNCQSVDYKVGFVSLCVCPKAEFSTMPAEHLVNVDTKVRFVNTSSLADSFGGSNLHFHWDFGDPDKYPGDTSNLFEPTWFYGKDTGTRVVRLVAYSDLNCRDSAEKMLRIVPEITDVKIPNVFNPGVNGTTMRSDFRPIINYAVNYHMQIFNASGQRVFETHDFNEAWNGANAMSGLYFYRITYENGSGQKVDLKGKVLLLR